MEKYLDKIDLILIMSVYPGFGGQKFIRNTFNKVRDLKAMIEASESNALIEIDGGVDNTNNKKLESLAAKSVSVLISRIVA